MTTNIKKFRITSLTTSVFTSLEGYRSTLNIKFVSNDKSKPPEYCKCPSFVFTTIKNG